MCATQVSTAGSCEYWFMYAVVGFYSDVISCELAQRGAAEASGSGGVQRVRAGVVKRSA